jgi:hypothetical protein
MVKKSAQPVKGASEADSLRDLLDYVLEGTKHLQGTELALRLGISESYVTKLRAGYRPDHANRAVREALESMSMQLIADSISVRERARPWGASSDVALRAQQAMLRELSAWVSQQQRAIESKLREADRAREGARVREEVAADRDELEVAANLSIEEVRAGVEALRQVEEQSAAKAKKRKPA